jgi:uncharacterized repeat protein (TIGR01451 family)
MRARSVVLLAAFLLLGGATARAATWQGTPLPPPNPPALQALGRGDRFGATIAVGTDVIAVGAYLSDLGGTDSGAVYLYGRQQGGWTLQSVIKGHPGDQLGFDLALDSTDTKLLVGAPFARGNGGVRCGAFRQVTLDGAHVTSEPESGPPDVCEEGAEFGSAVAVEGKILAVGARGASRRMGRVYATFINGGTLNRLEAPEIREGDELGTSLATDGKRLVAGAPFTDRNGTDSGSVYVFNRSGQVEIRRPNHGEALAAFGYSVAILDELLVVGAPLEDRGGNDSGAVHRFDDSRGTETVISGEKAGDQLGVSVTLGEGGLFAGARRAGAQRSGAVYAPSENGSLGAPILSPHPQNGAEFGFAVATRGPLLGVGAFLEDAPQEDSGAAYVFEQTVTVEFRLDESTVNEPAQAVAAAADLEVIVHTSNGLPTAAPVSVRLQVTCPTVGACAENGKDFEVDTETPQTIVAGTAPDKPYPLAMKILSDSEVEAPEVFVVHLLPELPAVAGPRVTHTVTILDSDHGPGIVLEPGSLLVREQGSARTFQVRLASRPTAAVTVVLTSTDATEGIVFLPRLVFTPSNWDQIQKTSLVPVDDPLCDGDQTYAVTAQAASADPSYSGRRRSVGARTEDNEVACLTVDKSVCVDADNTVVYTIAIANSGPQPVAAHLEDPLPPAVSVVTASADSAVATVDYLENSVVWNGLVSVGGNVVITIVAGLDDLPPGTEVSNLATLTWVRDDQGTVATLASPAVFRSGDLGCPPATFP